MSRGWRYVTVYADIVFAVNTVINYLLLLLGSKLTGYPSRPRRTLLGAVMGGGYAVCVLIPALSFFGTLWGKAVCFLLMGMTAYGFQRRALRPGIAALLCGGALAGFVFLLTQMLPPGIVTLQGHIYYPLSARVLVLMSGAFYLAAALLMAGMLKHAAGEMRRLELTLGARRVAVTALYDTGNTLTDPVGGKPVVVLEWQRGAELLGICMQRPLETNVTQAMIQLRERCPQLPVRLLPYRAVGTEGGLLLAVPCKARVEKRKPQDVLLAFSPGPVSDGGGYEALIGGTLY